MTEKIICNMHKSKDIKGKQEITKVKIQRSVHLWKMFNSPNNYRNAKKTFFNLSDRKTLR